MGKKVGCAVVKKNRRAAQVRLADGSSIYSAELMAIKTAMQYAFLSRFQDHVIFTDSESAVKAFQDPNFEHPYIAEAFNILHKPKKRAEKTGRNIKKNTTIIIPAHWST